MAASQNRRSRATLVTALAVGAVAGCAFTTVGSQAGPRTRLAPAAAGVAQPAATGVSSAAAHAAAATVAGAGVLAAAAKRKQGRAGALASRAVPASMPPAPPANVVVVPSDDQVGKMLCDEVAAAVKAAVAERGAFAIAIPGGSILKMLAKGSPALASVPWEKGIMAYVNHKCCPNEDKGAATHAKARDLFLDSDSWKGLKVITVGGSADGPAEAARYEELLREVPESTLPRNKEGMPVFDLQLIGVGDDGHFGSLYPNRPEIMDSSGKWVLAVDMKSPPSITLSPGAILNSKKIIVASAGVSEKYPMGKSAAMKVAIEGMEGPAAFPAQCLRDRATYLFDEAAASALSPEYLK